MKRILLLLLSFFAASNVLPQAGTLDPSFARSGVAYTDFGATININSDICQQMLLKGDGSFFLVFEMNEQAIVTHRLPDGALDKSYGKDGYSRAVFMRHPSAVLQPDGKIVLGGYATLNSNADFVIARLNVNGSPDPSFSGDGVATIDVSYNSDYLNDIALQADGKIIAVGRSYTASGNLSSLARLNPDGTLDNSFSNGGKLLSPVAAVLNAVAVQPDGKIVVAGDALQAMVARFLPDGNLDNSFSGDGVATIPMAGTSNSAKTLALEPNGKIAVGGFEAWAANRNFMVAQLLPDGSLDASFAVNGRAYTDFGADDIAQAVTVQPDGKLVAVGSTSPGSQVSFAVARYNSDGSLDNTFSGDGKETTVVGGSVNFAFDVAVQPGKGLLVAGWSMIGDGVDYSVVRYLANGSPDPLFADKGILLDYKPSGYTYFNATAIQKDGKIIAAGYANTGYGMQFAVARYNLDGSLDSTFGKKGMQSVNFGKGNSLAYDVAIQPDGGIVVAGCAGSGNYYYLAVARLNYDGSPDSSFNGNGRVLLDSDPLDLSIYQYARIVRQPGDKIVIAATAGSFQFTGDILLVRFFSNGKIDPSFGNGGKVITNLGSTSDMAWDLLVQPDGKLVVIGSFDYYSYSTQGKVAVLRYDVNGTLDPAFGNGGVVITDTTSRRYTAFAAALQADGKILAAGNTSTLTESNLLLLRYNSNGSLDTGFAQGGKLFFDMGSRSEMMQALAVQDDGKIVVAGYTFADRSNVPAAAIARFNPAGTFDTSFSSDGKVVGPPNKTMIFGLAIHKNRLYAVGSGMDGGANLGITEAYLLGPSCPGTLAVVIPDATALDKGVDANTVYKGYAPASQITLWAKASGGTAPYKYVWNNGAGTSSISVSPSTGTNYTVTVTDANGCVVTASKQVSVIDVRCGNNNDKVIMCQSAPGNGKSKSVCIASAAVAAQLKNGSRLGECVQAATTNRVREEATQEVKLLAWPNPSSSTFRLRLDNAVPGTYSVIVRDALGRVVEQKKWDGEQPEEIGANYKPGIYSVSVMGGDKILKVFVVKE